ncbi:MAG: RloB family protein [Candidatus Thiodiazotropha taylori]|nr:RloB family protein [Candidatus Thiodiazotropha taylori]MCG8106348.1 RloB family protein [Candidatus Thiodiazotropha taylori]MCG8111269.1 RloB family protein [Candidatus Thiodiazotropha taylori]MCW4278685.1 RloB family protein [Candidatus Thiodiazotropha taylori]MCW4283623.1 RloB family protein [Candidatus Thiodiazotropha taylori]
MGKDNQPKHRQARQLQRKKAKRRSYERILIVSEGSKTEPQYFKELRSEYRLSSANVLVIPSGLGTDPLSVVQSAREIFTKGDSHSGIEARSFEMVYVLVDRDDHTTYHQALDCAASLNRKLRNDLGQPILFRVIASVPCFELWLLLHFSNIDEQHPLSRQEVYARLKEHLPGYEKGEKGHFDATKPRIDEAIARSQQLANVKNEHDDQGPFCAVHELVQTLTNLGRSQE